LELRYRVNKKFQFVAFSDAGSAYGGNNSPYTNIDLLFSVGVGIRLQTPIGPIRLDVGKGTDGMKTSFGIGPTF
jgi:outer membrane protein insertion porin family